MKEKWITFPLRIQVFARAQGSHKLCHKPLSKV